MQYAPINLRESGSVSLKATIAVIISKTYQCDWPGCQNTINIRKDQNLSDFRWELCYGSNYALCAIHRSKSNRELIDALNREAETLCEDRV